MTKAVHQITLLLIIAIFLLAGCNYPSAPVVTTPDTGSLAGSPATEAAMTVAAHMTAMAQGTSVFPTVEVVEQTPTPFATNTSAAVIKPTNTSAPTATKPPPTATTAPTAKPLACNLASFEKDVTVPDNTTFSPKAAFTKTWRLKNAGSCTWTTNYAMVFVDGDQMGGKTTNLPQSVAPGDVVDVSIQLVAPPAGGTYKGNWMLSDNQGKQFGIGADAKEPVWVQIRVPQPTSGTVYNFADNYCLANWESGAGSLPCPGKGNENEGFVVHLDEPNQENRKENESTIWTQPQNTTDGWITGTYPKMQINAGDHFLADVGCLANHPSCDVIFQVNYRLGGPELKTLGEFHEVYDGKITRIDIDLSPLAGNDVAFVLTVRANGSGQDDAAFWLMPHIVRP